MTGKTVTGGRATSWEDAETMVTESPAPIAAGQTAPQGVEAATDPDATFGQDEMSILVWLISKGMAKSLSGLSQMLGHAIQVTSLDLKRLETRTAADALEPPGLPGVGVQLDINGDAKGHMVLIYDPSIAYWLIDSLLEQTKGSTQRLDDMGTSILGEMGNVAGAHFLNALADASNLLLMPSPPVVTVDAARSILNIPLEALAVAQEATIVIKATFGDETGDYNGRLVILPSTGFIKAVVKAAL